MAVIDKIVKWGVKKWLMGIVNDALLANSVNVNRALAIVRLAVEKIEAVLAFLKNLDEKISNDGKLDADEVDELQVEGRLLAERLASGS